MKKLGNYVMGRWIEGDGELQILADAVTGIPIYQAGTNGLDFNRYLQYARTVGNPALRKMSFHERGRMLKALALHLQRSSRKILSDQLSDRCHSSGFLD